MTHPMQMKASNEEQVGLDATATVTLEPTTEEVTEMRAEVAGEATINTVQYIPLKKYAECSGLSVENGKVVKPDGCTIRANYYVSVNETEFVPMCPQCLTKIEKLAQFVAKGIPWKG